MITSIAGLMNSGKTLYMTANLIQDFLEGRTIYTNYDLAIPHIKINRDYLIWLGENQPEFENASFGFDEIWIWLDCRDSGQESKIASYFFLQSSKDDSRIYLTAQDNTQNEKRLRQNLHRMVTCQRALIFSDSKKPTIIDSEERFIFKQNPEFYQYLYIIAEVYRRKLQGGFSKLFFSHYDFIKSSIYFNLFDTTQKIKKNEEKNVKHQPKLYAYGNM